MRWGQTSMPPERLHPSSALSLIHYSLRRSLCEGALCTEHAVEHVPPAHARRCLHSDEIGFWRRKKQNSDCRRALRQQRTQQIAQRPSVVQPIPGRADTAGGAALGQAGALRSIVSLGRPSWRALGRKRTFSALIELQKKNKRSVGNVQKAPSFHPGEGAAAR